MSESTLPPDPSFNPNIPVVTASGGSSAAYKDKNSPESIMKALHTLHVQTAVDQKYDVAESPYEDDNNTKKNKKKGEGFENPPPDTIVYFITLFVMICWSLFFNPWSVIFKRGNRLSKIVFFGLLCIVSLFVYGRYHDL